LACQQGAEDLDLVASDGIEGFGGPLGSNLFSGRDAVQAADGVGGIVDLGQGVEIPAVGGQAYGLASQIRRAASSIPSNIAEGCGRDGDPELARFCIIARGSATELEYQLLLARDLKLIPAKDYEKLSAQTVEIKRMLTVLLQKLTAEC